MKYRRADVKGGTYFFTVNLADRQGSLLIDEIDILRNGMSLVMQRHPFIIDAIVILPEHLHALWTLPEGDNDYATRWMLIKSSFSSKCRKENIALQAGKRKGNVGYGNAVIGNISFGMNVIITTMLSTFITIRSSTDT